MSKNDGDPAFPRPATPNTGALAQEGMSLRDYFAGQALVGLIVGIDPSPYVSGTRILKDLDLDSATSAASRAYAYADAMLAEREKGDE